MRPANWSVAIFSPPRPDVESANLAILHGSYEGSGARKSSSRGAIELLVVFPVLPPAALIAVSIPRRLRHSSGID